MKKTITTKTECSSCDDSRMEEFAKEYAENSLFGSKTKRQVAYVAYLKGLRMGKEYAIEQLEANRLAHCENLTEAEYNRESRFCSDFIDEHHRTPTFSDAIELTRKEMIDKACEWIMTTPMYAKQPMQLVEDFLKQMEL